MRHVSWNRFVALWRPAVAGDQSCFRRATLPGRRFFRAVAEQGGSRRLNAEVRIHLPIPAFRETRQGRSTT
jgi:hypothetical protein